MSAVPCHVKCHGYQRNAIPNHGCNQRKERIPPPSPRLPDKGKIVQCTIPRIQSLQRIPVFAMCHISPEELNVGCRYCDNEASLAEERKRGPSGNIQLLWRDATNPQIVLSTRYGCAMEVVVEEVVA